MRDRQPALISLVGATVFALTALAVAGEPGPVGFDADGLIGAQRARSDLSTAFMYTITRIGRGTFTTLAVTSLMLWFVIRRDRASALFLAITNIGSLVLTSSMKVAFARPRPELIERITDPQSLSFPSGHALSAMVFYTSVALVVHWRAAAWRAPIAAIATFMVAAIGMSRVYLGVHYPTDVLGGYGLGTAWVWLAYLPYKRSVQYL